MKAATGMAGMLLANLASAASASPEKDAVKAVIKAVKGGENLIVAFPNAITAKEAASLKRVSGCAALNLMKQKAGYYTVVWDCGTRGALGMRLELIDAKVTAISTMAIEMRPNSVGR